MNTLRKLRGTPSQEDVQDFRFGIALHDEPVPDFIRQMRVGPSGVLLISGDAQVLIPLAEVFKLAEANDGRFVLPAAPAPKVGGPSTRVQQRVAELKARKAAK